MTEQPTGIAREPIILASTSRTRRDLLLGAGIEAEAVAPQVDERAIEREADGLPPADLALRLAEAKARAGATLRPGRLVIGADQVLEEGGRVFHKPADAEAACAQIAALQGRTHRLLSAVAVARDGAVESFVEEARLTMRSLPGEAIARYVSLAGERAVTGSVGGYQLEGLGVHLFARIEGDHSTILGLPLLPLLARLRALGALAF